MHVQCFFWSPMPSTSPLYSLSSCSPTLRHYIQHLHVQKLTVHAGVLLSDATALSSPGRLMLCWVSACYACWFHARYVIEYLWLAQCLCLEQSKIRQTSSGHVVVYVKFSDMQVKGHSRDHKVNFLVWTESPNHKNAHVKYESPNSNGSKVIERLKFLWQTDMKALTLMVQML